jgi:hypothetical protein
MPLVRYFVVMGGILLSLLLLADSYLPKPEAAAASSDIDRSTIRVRSGQRWPEAVRIDTSAVVPSPAMVAASDQSEREIAPSPRNAYAAELPRQSDSIPASEKLEARQKPSRRLKTTGRSYTHNTGRRFANYQPSDSQGWPQAGW